MDPGPPRSWGILWIPWSSGSTRCSEPGSPYSRDSGSTSGAADPTKVCKVLQVHKVYGIVRDWRVLVTLYLGPIGYLKINKNGKTTLRMVRTWSRYCSPFDPADFRSAWITFGITPPVGAADEIRSGGIMGRATLRYSIMVMVTASMGIGSFSRI